MPSFQAGPSGPAPTNTSCRPTPVPGIRPSPQSQILDPALWAQVLFHPIWPRCQVSPGRPRLQACHVGSWLQARSFAFRPAARGLGSRPTPVPGQAQAPGLPIWIGYVARSLTGPVPRSGWLCWCQASSYRPWHQTCQPRHSGTRLSWEIHQLPLPECLHNLIGERLSVLKPISHYWKRNFFKFADTSARLLGLWTIKKTVPPKEWNKASVTDPKGVEIYKIDWKNNYLKEVPWAPRQLSR